MNKIDRILIIEENYDVNVMLAETLNSEGYQVISFRDPVKSISETDVKQLFHRFYTYDKARINNRGLDLRQ